jgi:hypothetical protein
MVTVLPVEPGQLVRWHDSDFGGEYEMVVNRVQPDFIEFAPNMDICAPSEVRAVLCYACHVDMMPPDDVWITCPNSHDLCIDCCGEHH